MHGYCPKRLAQNPSSGYILFTNKTEWAKLRFSRLKGKTARKKLDTQLSENKNGIGGMRQKQGGREIS